MRFQVPQFVDIEDKIIGPFTLKQFLMYLAAAMVLAPIYLVTDLSLFITLALPIIGVAVMFAHLKIHGKSFFGVLVAAGQFFMQGQLYLWRRQGEPKLLKIIDTDWEILPQEQPSYRRERSIAGIARALETEGSTVKSADVPDPFDAGS